MTRVALVAAGLTLLLDATAAAQYGRRPDRLTSDWETDRYRVRRITIAPGAKGSEAEGPDSVVVILTAGLDGRMPPAEAVWEPGGLRAVDNRGAAQFEAIVIELKDAPPGSGATPPEAIESSGRVEVQRLIDNRRVLVVKLRYEQATYADAPHFHPNDTLAVYQTAGYIWRPGESTNAAYFWPSIAWSTPAFRVQRGDVDLVPANTLHAFSNAGGDPLEFLVLILK
jgi:mannose-6-phosphate isomerase-like protein (cupin superfamily)